MTDEGFQKLSEPRLLAGVQGAASIYRHGATAGAAARREVEGEGLVEHAVKLLNGYIRYLQDATRLIAHLARHYQPDRIWVWLNCVPP